MKEISDFEVKWALGRMKRDKAVGLDETQVGMFILTKEVRK